jgi:hypothetical protein
MAALPPKADIRQLGRHVRFVPKADKRIAAKQLLYASQIERPNAQFAILWVTNGRRSSRLPSPLL